MASRAESLRYGVIGTGMMGVEHINNLLHLDGAEVVAASDPDETSLQWAQLAVGEDRPLHRFSDHRDLIAAGVCDAVVIASPNHTHVDVLADVLASDLHVLIEKPLCTTVDDCLRVIEAAAHGAADRVVWMGLEYRYMPPTQALLAELRAGVAGRLHMVAVREHRFPFLRKVGNWNRFTRNTGGTLVEKCCHFFDLMNQCAAIDDPSARPARVYASGAQSVNHLDERYDGETPDILDNAYVIVEFTSGLRGMLDLCMFAEASRNEQEISAVGDAGKVEALVSEAILRVGRRADGIGVVDQRAVRNAAIKHQGLHHGASYLEHVDFLDAVRSGRPAAVTLDDGLWSVAVGQAAHLSIERGAPVHIDELVPASVVR